MDIQDFEHQKITDVPIGTTLFDREGDVWVITEDGAKTMGDLGVHTWPFAVLDHVEASFGPFTCHALKLGLDVGYGVTDHR